MVPAFAAAPLLAESDMMQTDKGSPRLPRPRDGNVAVQEELDAARRAATLAAYDLFLARHGDHLLAAIARRERARLAARGPRPLS